jgi:chaperonin cofactor prefoldin
MYYIMRRNYSFDTIKWVNEEIDKLHEESIQIGEMLLNEENYNSVKILDSKLKEIEKKMKYLQSKLEFERNNN